MYLLELIYNLCSVTSHTDYENGAAMSKKGCGLHEALTETKYHYRAFKPMDKRRWKKG